MAIYERLVNVRDQMPPEYRNMEYATPLPPHTNRDDGHKDGVNGGKTLAQWPRHGHVGN